MLQAFVPFLNLLSAFYMTLPPAPDAEIQVKAD